MTVTVGLGLGRPVLWVGLLVLPGLPGCSPLPGNSVDPVYLRYGSGPVSASAQTAAAPTMGSTPIGSKATGTSVWVGRYRDSRGDGEITVSFVRKEAILSGIWKLRTGGGGPFNATVAAHGGKLTFRMENTGPECPGTLEGWVEMGEATIVGAYHGKDCEGVVSDGRLDLRPK